jgi:hypothetical protein
MNANNNSKQINKPKIKTRKRKPRVKGRLPNNRKKRANVIRGRKIAAASAENFRKKFSMLRQNGNSVRVTGRDLIYSIPDDLTSPIQSTNVMTVIPANPAYWKGTRIAALASGYQNYRPLLFKITYIPMCAVTQQGNVIGGTIWDDGIDNDNLQQSLRTSNGGFMTQCYVPHTTRIRPRTNLQFNLYRMGGEFATTSNPFIFVALAIGCKNTNNQRVTPGYFYVTWSFELKNPIGSINTYNNTGLITYNNLQLSMNNTLVNIDPNSDVPFGAYIDVEEGDNGAEASYNGTKIEMNENTPIWAFTSVTKASTARFATKIPIIYDALTTAKIRIGYEGYNAFMIANDENYVIYIPQTPLKDEKSWQFYQNSSVKFEINDLNQNFGSFVKVETIQVSLYSRDTLIDSEYNAKFNTYVASKSIYQIKIINKAKNEENKKEEEIKKLKEQINNIKIDKSNLPKIQEQLDYNSEDSDENKELIAETETIIKPKEKSRSKSKNSHNITNK